MEYVDEKTSKRFEMCHQHTEDCFNSGCCETAVHLCCFEQSIKLVEILPLQAKYKATLVLNLTSHFFLS